MIHARPPPPLTPPPGEVDEQCAAVPDVSHPQQQ